MKYLNFFETYFGISPDGGDGTWEVAALVLIVMLGRYGRATFTECP